MSTTPSWSTMPGVPTPMPSSGAVARLMARVARSSTNWVTSCPFSSPVVFPRGSGCFRPVPDGGAEHRVLCEVQTDDLQPPAV